MIILFLLECPYAGIELCWLASNQPFGGLAPDLEQRVETLPATGINLWAVETSEASQANARIFNRFFDGTAEPMLFPELIYGTTVHPTGAQHDLQQNVPRAREKHSFQFALTGTGAFFGVLR